MENKYLGESFNSFIKSEDLFKYLKKDLKVLKKQMKKETTFRKTIINKFNKAGIYARPMEVMTIPGFPDCFISMNNNVILLELKVIEKYNEKHKLSSIFEETQPVFYLEYLTKSKSDNLYCLIKIEKKYFCFNITKEIAKNFYSLTFKDVFGISDTNFYVNSVDDVINRIKNFIDPFF